ncbi:MAG: short-chain dehydrogenase [Bacteroidetes bacterium]|nr:MAG: short-chain dehydrogenase [Bacteroidota bacterium]
MNNLFDLKDEIIIITGGTGTIGKAFSKALLNAGAKVILWSRGKTVPLNETIKEIEIQTNTQNSVFAYKVDVSDKESVKSGLAKIVKDIGIPTVLINGAGGNKGKSSFIDADIQVFEDVLKMNLLGGLMIPTQILASYWIKNKVKGSIINVASAASYIPLSGVWAYDAAKSAVLNLTMGAAKEFAPYEIRVNGIAPGFFIGHQNRGLLYEDYENKKLSDRGKAIINHTPYNRFGETEDLYGAVVFLASSKASGFITGVTLPIDGGYLIDNI